MIESQTLMQPLALTIGIAWASGISLGVAIGMLRPGGLPGCIDLPADLEVLQGLTAIIPARTHLASS